MRKPNTKVQEEKKRDISDELQQLISMPGWEHIITIKNAIQSEVTVTPRDFANLSAELIAYKTGLKDALDRLFTSIDVNIKQGSALYKKRLAQLTQLPTRR